jgi:primase-polymerase (primpol)-like protein
MATLTPEPTGATNQDRGAAGGGLAAALDLDKIPQELKLRPQWVVWQEEIREGKKTKVPYQPRNPKQKASSTNPATWGTYEQALSAAQTKGFHGIGYVFSPQDDYAGVDLDNCRDRETGEIEPWARANIDRLQSYTEKSPSEAGLHILVKGKVPTGGNKKCKVEMYSHGRYFTMTGHHLEGTPTTIEARQTELEALHKAVFGTHEKPVAATNRPTPTPLRLTDFALIDKAKLARNGKKFARLWGGDTTGYDTPSEATAALLCLLAYWTNRDHGRMDRLFRQSGLIRKKWDRPQSGSTWGALEIDKAIALTQEGYTTQKPRTGPRGK